VPRDRVLASLRLLLDEPKLADLVVANIVADVLLDHAAPLCSLVAREPAGRLLGWLVLSGLRTADLAGVSERFTAMLGQAPQRASRNGWECLVWHGRGARLD
jgi:ribosomal protein L11 methylase PrmA